MEPAAMADSRTPSIMAVNVFRMNPSTEVGSSGVDVNHPRGDRDVPVAGIHEERIEPPADEGVSAGVVLELDLAPDRFVGGLAIGVEVGGAVVALDDGHRATSCRACCAVAWQRFDGAAEMLEQKAHEDVIELFESELAACGLRKGEHVGLREGDGVCPAADGARPLPRAERCF